jgi:superfamily II DNA or RNA helicase
MELRLYQKKIIFEVKKNLMQHRKICIQAPCGSGKSVIIGNIIADATKKKNNVLFLVHRKELIQQIYDTLMKFDVDVNYIKLMMVQTACRRLKSLPAPSIIITDENHHCLAKSYIKIYDYFPKAFLLGFTATPIRLSGEGLGNIYNYLVEGPKISWLIENNYLSPYKLYSVKLANTDNLQVRAGDYRKNQINELMEQNTIYGKTVEQYKKLASGKKTIVYCSSIESSIETAKEFVSAEISAIHLDGKTAKNEREDSIEKFRQNKIKVLCNVDLFGEGFDVPDCECVILLRPTKSLSLFIQQSMRSMRYKEGKEAIIIDHVGNCFEHGLPDDERIWLLKGKKKNKENEIKIRECKECFAVIKPGLKECPYCGYNFPVNNFKTKATIADIELEEIKRKDILRMKPFSYIKKLNTLKEILDFVELKNYSPGVIFYQVDERKDEITITEEDLKRWQKYAGYKRGWWTHKKDWINKSESEVI